MPKDEKLARIERALSRLQSILDIEQDQTDHGKQIRRHVYAIGHLVDTVKDAITIEA